MNIDKMLEGHQWDFVPWHEVVEAVKMWRSIAGCKPIDAKLLTWPQDSTKFKKGIVPVVGFSGLPARLATSSINMCSHSTRECRKHCINLSGKGGMDHAQRGRMWKTLLFQSSPNVWFTKFWHELELAAKRYEGDVRARLNVFTDVAWERTFPNEFWTHFLDQGVLFHDYTKNWDRRDFPANYSVVFSASERTWDSHIELKLMSGERVAIVFDVAKSQPLPETYLGFPVVDGDVDDDLWARPAGHIVGLRAKGSLRKSNSPFKRKAA